MSAPARLAGFAAGLAALFGASVAVGSAVDAGAPARGDAEPKAEHGGEMAGGAMEESSAPAGLAVAEGGLRLEPATTTFQPRRTGTYAFRISGARGATVRDFDVEHTKRMHLIAVRRDLTGFQHLHPRQGADGSWRTPLRLAEPGSYRVFADFSAKGERRTLATDLTVPGDQRPQPLPAPSSSARAGDLDVRLGGDDEHLDFQVQRGGRPVAVQEYLGADGHLVALREGDLAFLHVHPEESSGTGEVKFSAHFPSPGRYRLFLQVQVGGKVKTAAFTKEVR
ncbi:MAG: hypothetical protein HZB46_09240 [Solirubrobacterales bacterium]|nr:hypothetical protein [Solirubrobacterales bacterium]